VDLEANWLEIASYTPRERNSVSLAVRISVRSLSFSFTSESAELKSAPGLRRRQPALNHELRRTELACPEYCLQRLESLQLDSPQRLTATLFLEGLCQFDSHVLHRCSIKRVVGGMCFHRLAKVKRC
jgi:hypothetical protein